MIWPVKSCFLKIKADIPLALNLCKTAKLFLISQNYFCKVNLKIYFHCYYTSRIWCIGLCSWKSYNVIIYYFIITYYMFWKWSHIRNKSCNRIVWYNTFFIVDHSVSDAQIQAMHPFYLYWRRFKFLYTGHIRSFFPTERSIHLSWPKWFSLLQIKIKIKINLLLDLNLETYEK